jgi:hypothetical protein
MCDLPPLRIPNRGLVETYKGICDLLVTIGQKKRLEVGKKHCLIENWVLSPIHRVLTEGGYNTRMGAKFASGSHSTC